MQMLRMFLRSRGAAFISATLLQPRRKISLRAAISVNHVNHFSQCSF